MCVWGGGAGQSLKVAEFWRRAIAGVENAFQAYKTQAHTYALHTHSHTHTNTGPALWGITGRGTAHNSRHSSRVKKTVGECE